MRYLTTAKLDTTDKESRNRLDPAFYEWNCRGHVFRDQALYTWAYPWLIIWQMGSWSRPKVGVKSARLGNQSFGLFNPCSAFFTQFMKILWFHRRPFRDLDLSSSSWFHRPYHVRNRLTTILVYRILTCNFFSVTYQSCSYWNTRFSRCSLSHPSQRPFQRPFPHLHHLT